MSKLFYYIFCLALLLNFNIYSQSSNVVSGPMLSYIDAYSTQMWFLLKPDASKIEVNIKDYDNSQLLEYDFEVKNTHKIDDYIPFTVVLEKLRPNTEYIASVFVDGVLVKEMDIFTKRPHLDDVQFLLGYELSATYSKTMFSHMRRTNSDFMVWLGGHVSFSSPITFDSMVDNYINVRKDPDLNDFMSSLPQISTWGDLDYGERGGGYSWALKDSSYLAFSLFWPNSLHKTYNYTFFDYGTYQRYAYNDVDIFLLDCKTFKSDNNTTLYGDKQIERLFQEIKNNVTSFTIIASPSPFTFESKQSFMNYKKQFDYFMYRLRVSGANGIVLLSAGSTDGSTRINKYDLTQKNWKNKVKSFYPLYEFNISSLGKNNFSSVSVNGVSGKRILSFATYNENGNPTYRKSIHQNELTN